MNDLTREHNSTDSWKYLLVSSCGALASGRAQSVPEECNIRGTAGRWMTGTLPRNKRALSMCVLYEEKLASLSLYYYYYYY